jgi:hypothetical protein
MKSEEFLGDFPRPLDQGKNLKTKWQLSREAAKASGGLFAGRVAFDVWRRRCEAVTDWRSASSSGAAGDGTGSGKSCVAAGAG